MIRSSLAWRLALFILVGGFSACEKPAPVEEVAAPEAPAADSPASKVSSIGELPLMPGPGSGTVASGSTIQTSDGLRRVALAPSHGRVRTNAAIIMGPPG